jgi:hypothetical protein
LFTFVFIGGLKESVIGMPGWEFIGSLEELGIIEAAVQFLPFGALNCSSRRPSIYTFGIECYNICCKSC